MDCDNCCNFGILVMAYDNTEENSLPGLIFGLISALGFSFFLYL